MTTRKLALALIGSSFLMLSACSIAGNYSEQEKEMVSNLTPSKYQPATRQMRTNIETQDALAQAAFWSREYQLNPADLESAVKLASAVRKMGNPSKAYEVTQTTRAMYPNDPYLIAEHAAALIALERGSEAIKPLDSALRTAPGYARLWSLKGAALDQSEQYDLARRHYSRALQITPHDPNIMANMGLSFALAGDAATAEQWLRRAASHPEAGDGIKQNLNMIMQLQGKPATQMGMAAPRSAPTAPAQAQYRQPAQASQAPAATFGHRASRTVIGQQAGQPTSASAMARSVASGSSQSKMVIPYNGQNQPAPSGNILDRIANSVQHKQASVASRPRAPQQPVPSQTQQHQTAPGGYPNPYAAQIRPAPYPVQEQARRGAARRR